MSKGAITLYHENNIILTTIEGVAHIPIDDNLFDLSYELEPQNFRRNLAM